MNKMLMGVAAGVACAIGLATAGSVQAGVVVQRTTVVTARPYYQTYGARYNNSYYFAGRNHSHWGHRQWDTRYRAYTYWEPSLRTYFYYDNARSGYYPCR